VTQTVRTAAPARLDTGDLTALALLNCLAREISGPERQIWIDGDRAAIRLARVGVTLRAVLARPPVGPVLRLAPPIEELRGTEWLPVAWSRLADLVAGELELATGIANPEFSGQVRASRDALDAMLAARSETDGAAPGFVESEQGLVAGHRFHPSPKDRGAGPVDGWLPYAPEARARFRLRWLAVREEVCAGEGDLGLLDATAPQVPSGFKALPAHPWQYELVAGDPVWRAALRRGLVRDLGAAGPMAVATSSVRTVYLPEADVFGKFSLDVRITNCVRKNAWYELAGAVALTGLLGPVFDDLAGRFDGCVLLGEPGYRTAALADRRVYEGLGVIVREGLRRVRGTPVLAGALADPYGHSPVALPRLLQGADAERALTWWDAYVRLVVPPVLHAYLKHGVVLEPHLQNVLVALDDDDLPVQAVFRDLEGTKLLPETAMRLTGPPERVRAALTYDEDRGWQRVVYCLFVNHLAEIAATLGDAHPELEPALWESARSVVTGYGLEHLPEGSPRLRALLAGVPLPAKANLRARWSRAADRTAGYVTVRSPFAVAPETGIALHV
jgi:siderophore synthetase component